jgi:hypothetical protein
MSIKEKIAKKSTMTKGGVGSPGSIGVDTDINDRFSIMKSDAAKKWLAKRQKARGGQGVNGAKYRIQASTREGNRPGSVYKADGYVRTIYDLIDLHYNFVPEAMGKTSGVSKADDPLLTDTPGVHNEVYGSDVFVLLNTEQNVFGLLETRPWNKSGERIIDAYGASAASGGVDENAAIPDTVKPTFDTYEMDPKTVVHSFDVSQVEQLLAATEDDAIADDPFAMLRQFFGEGLPDQQTGGGEHPKHINEMLCQDAVDNSNNPLNLLSIDRAIADEAEATANGGSGEYDVYGFDRTNGEFESNVIMDNNGQVFHLDLMDDAMRLVKENSDKNPQQNPEDFVWVTNHDTYQRIENEMGGKERIDTVRTQMGVNGIQTEPGNDVGVGVASYKDIPIIESVDIPKDDIGRIYLLDTTAIWCKMLLPTQFYSTGTEVGDGPFPIGRLGNEGAYVTIGEVTLKNPLTQAKIRDLE